MSLSSFPSAFILAAALSLPQTPTYAQDEMPSAETIISKSLDRAKWVRSQHLNTKYLYTQLVTVEKLDDDFSVKEFEKRDYQIILLDDAPYSKLVSRNDKPLSDDELRREQVREDKFRKALTRKRAGGHDPEELSIDEELVQKYTFSVLGKEVIEGRSAFILSFKPKSPNLPIRKTVDRVLNGLAGKVWLDENEYDLVKLDIKLTGDVTVVWGLLGTLYNFDLKFEQVRLNGGIWMPKRLDTYIRARKLFSKIHQRQKAMMKDFKQAS